MILCMFLSETATNSVFAVGFAHPNTFGLHKYRNRYVPLSLNDYVKR